MSLLKWKGLLSQCYKSVSVTVQQRGITRIPLWEYHIRFDAPTGRKVPAKDVLDRFKRLNNGMWIKGVPGRHRLRYMKKEPWLTDSLQHKTCNREECWILDRLMTPFWQEAKHYVDDPYEPYHVRHGFKGAKHAPRVGYNRKMLRERKKIMLDDTTADQYFRDR